MTATLEYVLTHNYKAEMIAYLNAHQEDFEEAMKLAIADRQPYSWRAAWLLWSCMEKNDPRIRPHIQTYIDAIPFKADGHKRELLKILQAMVLNEEQQGALFTICTDIWIKIGQSPSVRYRALMFMVTIARQYPELANEIILLSLPQYTDPLSSGIRKAALRMIKELKTAHFDEKSTG
jgi:hypothetical protein